MIKNYGKKTHILTETLHRLFMVPLLLGTVKGIWEMYRLIAKYTLVYPMKLIWFCFWRFVFPVYLFLAVVAIREMNDVQKK